MADLELVIERRDTRGESGAYFGAYFIVEWTGKREVEGQSWKP